MRGSPKRRQAIKLRPKGLKSRSITITTTIIITIMWFRARSAVFCGITTTIITIIITTTIKAGDCGEHARASLKDARGMV